MFFILYNKFKIPKLIKVIICIILIWIVVYSVDYIRVTNYYRKPIFSITVKSNRVSKDNADYIEKNTLVLVIVSIQEEILKTIKKNMLFIMAK